MISYCLTHTDRLTLVGTQTTVAGVMDVFGFVSLDTGPYHTYLRLMTTCVHIHCLTLLLQYSSVVLPL